MNGRNCREVLQSPPLFKKHVRKLIFTISQTSGGELYVYIDLIYDTNNLKYSPLKTFFGRNTCLLWKNACLNFF